MNPRPLSARKVALVGALTHAFPELMPILQEHLRDEHGELLTHIYMTEIETWAEAAVAERREVVVSLFAWLEEQYERGNPEVRELLDDSFIETLPHPGRPMAELRDLLGPQMAAEAERQLRGPVQG